MLINLYVLLLAAALVITILHSINRAPLWPAVLVVIVALLVGTAR